MTYDRLQACDSIGVVTGTWAGKAAKVRVPNPADRQRELIAEERAMRGEALDAELPAYAVVLPAGWFVAWHKDWLDARRAYILGSDRALDRMTAYVTMTSPPLAADVARQEAQLAAKHAAERAAAAAAIPSDSVLIPPLAWLEHTWNAMVRALCTGPGVRRDVAVGAVSGVMVLVLVMSIVSICYLVATFP